MTQPLAPNEYVDRRGRRWALVLDLPTAMKIDKSDFTAITPDKFSILTPGPDLYKMIITNPQLMFAVIWAMVQDQVSFKHMEYNQLPEEARDELLNTWLSGKAGKFDVFPLDPKEDTESAELEFVSGVHGPTINAARKALVEAISDFFPEHRTALSVLLRQVTKAVAKIADKLEVLEPEMERVLDMEMDKGIEKLRSQIRSTSGSKPSETSVESLQS